MLRKVCKYLQLKNKTTKWFCIHHKTKCSNIIKLCLVFFCYFHFGKYHLERTVVSLFHFRSELLNFKIKYCIHMCKANSTKDFFISFPSVWRSQNITKNWINIFYRFFRGCISRTVIHLGICGFFDFSVSVTESKLRVCRLDL